MLDRMVALRKEGYTSVQIGAVVGASERTVKRYLGGVTPELERRLGIERGKLLNVYAAWLENLVLGALKWGIGTLNTMLVALREAMRRMDDLTVGRLCQSKRARDRFFDEFVRASPIGKRIEEYNARTLDARSAITPELLASNENARDWPLLAMARRSTVDLGKMLLDCKIEVR